jgi:hypothetical protein
MEENFKMKINSNNQSMKIVMKDFLISKARIIVWMRKKLSINLIKNDKKKRIRCIIRRRA